MEFLWACLLGHILAEIKGRPIFSHIETLIFLARGKLPNNPDVKGGVGGRVISA